MRKLFILTLILPLILFAQERDFSRAADTLEKSDNISKNLIGTTESSFGAKEPGIPTTACDCGISSKTPIVDSTRTNFLSHQPAKGQPAGSSSEDVDSTR